MIADSLPLTPLLATRPCRYIGRKYNMLGDSEQDKVTVDMVMEGVEVRTGMFAKAPESTSTHCLDRSQCHRQPDVSLDSIPYLMYITNVNVFAFAVPARQVCQPDL